MGCVGERSTEKDDSGAAPTRLGHGVRDMAWSLVVLLLIIGVIVGIVGTCQFSPGRPTVDDDAVPTVDVDRELDGMANRLDFPIRQPDLPEGWVWTSLEATSSAARVICYGILMPKEDTTGGVPYVRVVDMKGDQINLSTIRRTHPEIAAKYSSRLYMKAISW
jgi:hypothetical protein